MADSAVRIPRASIAVSILHDPDYLELVGHAGGFAAFGVFTALLVAAKQQQNKGSFRGLSKRSVATLIGATVDQLTEAVELIQTATTENGNKPWITDLKIGIKIRKFERWNTNPDWGGTRQGAGRPQKNQDIKMLSKGGNQDIKTYSRCAPSSSSSYSSLEKKDPSVVSPEEQPGEEDPITASDRQVHKGDFETFWLAIPVRHRQSKVACREEFIRARRRGADPEFLAARVQEYYQSHQGRGEFANQPKSWLAGGKYDDPPESWKSSDVKAAKARNERLIVGEAQS